MGSKSRKKSEGGRKWLGLDLDLDGRTDRRGFWEGEERSEKALACLRSFVGASFFSLL